MSREILFKAKRKNSKDWVVGYYQKRFDCFEKEEHFIFCSTSHRAWEYAEIDPSTLCQYTGLTDKNGNKIWENDIVTFPNCEMSTESGYGDLFVNAGKVAYDIESMSYLFTNRVTVYMGDIIIKDEVAVIGNVFDNAEFRVEDENEEENF